MEYLEAALAFSLLMIIFSTLATTLTETWLRLVAARPQVLIRMIRRFLKDDPFVSGALGKLEAQGEALATEELRKFNARVDAVADELTRNPAMYSDEEKRQRWFWIRIYYVIRRFFQGDGNERVDKLTLAAFLQRLARTEVGRKIVERAEDEQERILENLTMRYERYSAAAQELFRKRAQSITMAVSVGMAFTFNIDSALLFRHLMDNPDTRSQLLAEAETVVEDNKAAMASLERVIQTLDDDATAEEKLEALKQAAADTEGESDDLLVQAATDLRTTLDKLDTEMALPVGYEFAPWRKARKCAPGEVAKAKDNGDPTCLVARAYALWFGQVLLAGFLIGLGGPFWYRFYSSLSNLLQVLRALRGNPSPETLCEDAPDEVQSMAKRMLSDLKDGKTKELARKFRITATGGAAG